MDADKYTVLTPLGELTAIYDSEDAEGDFPPVRWEGAPEALDYLRMVAQGCTDARGASINIDRVAPDTLEHFCSPDGAGVVVLLSPELMLERAALPSEKDLPSFQGARLGVFPESAPLIPTMDSAASAMSAIEKLGYIKALRASRKES